MILSVTLFFLRQDKPAYRSEDTPEGVVHNYVTAIQLGDYERAYTYLAEKSDKPTFDGFRRAFLSGMNPGEVSLQIGGTYFSGDEATVEITILHFNNGLFGETYREQQNAQLTLQNGDWKLYTAPYPYWSWDWYQATLKTP